MTQMDIGIDFTRNEGPQRTVVLTDWEARLVEHCLGLYMAAAEEIDDVTAPLAQGALLKVRLGRVPARGERPRKNERHRLVRELRRAEGEDEWRGR